MVGKEELMESFFLLANSCYKVWDWKMDREFRVLTTDCPLEELYLPLLLGNGGRRVVESHMDSGYYPMILAVTPILSWILAFEKDFSVIYVKGPFFSSYNDANSYRSFLEPYDMDAEDKDALERSLMGLPELTYSTSLQMCVMLHYAIHQEKAKPRLVPIRMLDNPHVSSHGSVMTDSFSGEVLSGGDMEQIMLHKVMEGDLSVLEDMEKAVLERPGITDRNYKDFESYRQGIHTLLTLISRAAIEGGMPRKSARALCADYRRMLNGCSSMNDIISLSRSAVEQFVSRVSDMKRYAHWSKPIQKCREYIDTHLDENITLSVLARHVGYTTFYLSRKFNQETCYSLADYVQKAKMERGAFLLRITDLSIEDISGQLGYSSSSYFSSVFRKQMGESPSSYRKKNQLF